MAKHNALGIGGHPSTAGKHFGSANFRYYPGKEQPSSEGHG
jgi:hypothetical protein